jgi:NodT family efflux transporter outer membrane factor (OMF) lipoprotein
MNNRSLRAAGLCLLLAPLASCMTVGPDYALPQDSAFMQEARHPTALDAQGSKAADPTRSADEGRWWALYDDPRLNALVEQSLQANTELKVAAARLTQAQARYAQAQSAGGFSGGAFFTAGRGRVSQESMLQAEPIPVFNFATGGISVSYQLDLFGQIRRATEAARANVQATQAAGDLVRISVAAQVVGAYVEICHSNHELDIARHALQLQQRSREVARRMLAAGRGTATAVERADAQAAALQASLPPLQSRRQAAGYELAALLGHTPDQVPADAMQCQDPPQLRQPIPLGDGYAMLRRRPDVRRAERELAAATAEIGVATAALYPDVTLGASVGSNGLLDDFGKLATEQWTLAPMISWSFPTNGAQARVEAAKAEAKVALAEFDHTVLQALKETQTILTRYAEDARRVAALRQARDSAAAAAADAHRMYKAGRAPYLSSLDANRTLAAAEASLAGGQAQVSQDQIRLFLALGGGWRTSAAGPSQGGGSPLGGQQAAGAAWGPTSPSTPAGKS